MIAKRSTMDTAGNTRIPNDCSSPTSRALMKLPAKLPSPPMTTTTNAVVSTSPSMPSATATVGAESAPANPASQLPNTKTWVYSVATSTPRAPSISRSTVAARISMPQRVR